VWLNVLPDKSDITRLEQIKRSGRNVKWPEHELHYLFDLLLEIGPIVSNDMGSSPLTWQDIQSYQSVIGFDIRPWEAKILRTASIEYLTQMRVAVKANCPPPDIVVNQDPVKMAKHVKSTLRGL
jgi:hypothetical protein